MVIVVGKNRDNCSDLWKVLWGRTGTNVQICGKCCEGEQGQLFRFVVRVVGKNRDNCSDLW